MRLDHCQFYDVSRRPLDWCIHRHAFCQGSLIVVRAFDSGKIAPSAKNRCDEAVVMRFFYDFIKEIFDAAALFKITCNVVGSFLS